MKSELSIDINDTLYDKIWKLIILYKYVMPILYIYKILQK